MSDKTLAMIANAFGDDNEQIEPEFCPGNSHLLIETYYGSHSARCACGATVTLGTDDTWAHRSVDGTMSVACPPYDCRHCGQRHNQPKPVVYTMTACDTEGRPLSRSVGSMSALSVLARHALRRDWTNIEVRDDSGRDVTFDIPEFRE